MDFVVDLSTVKNKDDLHNLLARTFDFPEYYGKNLDALFDLITEPHEFWNVTFENCSEVLSVLDEDYFEALKQTFADAEYESSNIKTEWK